MMLELDEVVRRTGVRRVEIVAWIEEQLVLPTRDGDRWHFSDADVARVELILELRRDLRIGGEALPVVLSLMDRVYAMRRTLREIAEALRELPDAERERVRAIIEKRHAG